MVEGTRLTGVANVSATVSAGLLGFASLLAVFSLVLPWWVGSTTVGQLASQSTIESTITLWAFDLTIGVQVSDGAGGTTLETEKRDMTWSQMCEVAAQTEAGEPGACSSIPAIRAFAVLTPIFGLAGTAVLLLSRTVSPLLLLLGAFLALLTGLFAVAGVGMGIMVSMSGLSGMGVICLLGAVFIAMTSLCGAFYGAGIAMPIDPPPEKKRNTRQERVQAQRDKDLELAEQLDANVASRMQDQYEGELIGTGRSGSDDGHRRKAPIMLKKVIFWNQEHSGDADAEGIPTEWLEKAFQEIDEDRSGAIELEELVECLNLCGLNATLEVVSTIMAEFDTDQSGNIDIKEFVAFFRQLEELDRFQAKTAQRAQFAQFLCNFCFIAHIIIVSAMLMNFINMEEADDPDSYLIMRNMLMAFSVVLGVLLVTVICLPAIRLTLGANMTAWERQYNLELKRRIHKPQADDNSQDNLRQAAWSTGNSAADGLTDITVNAAMFGASYRVSKQNFFQQPAVADAGPRQPSKMSRHSSKMLQFEQQQLPVKSPAAAGVLKAKDGGLERYDPDAYRTAALQSMETAVPASFSPMQVRDMDMPKEEPQMPGTLALQDGAALPGGLTGTGFYQRGL